eukprot:5967498-Pyramimonas_sp.AAC.1
MGALLSRHNVGTTYYATYGGVIFWPPRISIQWATVDLHHRRLLPLGRLTCIFGCHHAPHSLQHYLCCKPFRELIGFDLGDSRPATPLGRLGLLGSAVEMHK